MQFWIPCISLNLLNVIKLHLLCVILVLLVNMLDYLLLILNSWVLGHLKLFIVIYGFLLFQVLRATNIMFFFLIIIPNFLMDFPLVPQISSVWYFYKFQMLMSQFNLSLVSNIFNVILGVNLIIKCFTNFVSIGVSLFVSLVSNLISKWKIREKNSHNQ